MSCRSSPIPFISISPAPEEDPIVEPFSPFSALPIPQSNQNGFRPSHLTPPTSITSFKRSLSSLHPAPAVGQGLEIQKFQVLLAASKQRNVSGKSNQSVEFRKEIAKKAHKNGHSERRALFLSKLQAPLSPTATVTPETPPESPTTIYHSSPSPVLQSPLTLIESQNGNHINDVSHTWVEHADEQPKFNPSFDRSSNRPHGAPSLDQISARLIPRPANLDDIKITCDAKENSPRPSVGIGRLRMPLRTHATPQLDNQPTKPTLSKPIPPSLSLEHCTKTYVIPRSRSSVQLTESNFSSLNSRDEKASNMLYTLRKRVLSLEFNSSIGVQEEEHSLGLRWRCTPADMTPLHTRFGFEHPVLLSGGF